MEFQQFNQDIIGLISSFLPYDEIIKNLRNVNKMWRDSINNSFECWLSVDLTETVTEFQSSKEDILLEEIKKYSNIISSIRFSNPRNNISGFLSKMILNDGGGRRDYHSERRCYKIWSKLESIEVYNKSLMVPINKSYNILPFKSLFRLGINENILQLLKNYEISGSKCIENENTLSNGNFSLLNSFTSVINYYPFKSVKRIIIDYPISTRELNILSNCFPCLKDIIITRLFHETNIGGNDDNYDKDDYYYYNERNKECVEENRRIESDSASPELDFGSVEFQDKYGGQIESEIASCWEAIYNFLQIIPPNQLRILQFNVIPPPNPKSGRWTIDHTISRIVSENNKANGNCAHSYKANDSNHLCSGDKVIKFYTDEGKNANDYYVGQGQGKNDQITEPFEIYKAIKRSNREYINYKNKVMRANEYYSNNSGINSQGGLAAPATIHSESAMMSFDEVGDKLMKYILDMHSDSLVALSCPDLEVSYSLYKRLLGECPRLKLWDLPGWRIFSCIN